MNKEREIRNEIKEMIDQVPAERLSDILAFVRQFGSRDERSDDILSYFGIWQDLDEELFDDLTIHLHENRMEPNRAF